MEKFGLIIDGKKLYTEKYHEVMNPSTEEVVGKMPLGSPEDLDNAVNAAARAFQTWKLTSHEERARACYAIADLIEAHVDEMAQLITLEQGKPLNGFGSRFEIGGMAVWTRMTASIELPNEIIQDDESGRVELVRRPIGVVGSITPWNWPVSLAAAHIIPAIRAGNTVVIKPSHYTPFSTIRMVELMNEILPAGVVNVVSGDNALGAAMTAHPGISKIAFTGSTPTGRNIVANSAKTLKRMTLELGGNDAGIVLPDANVSEIVEKLFWGAFINNGQTCAALKRLYVHDEIYDDVCEALAAYAKTVVVGDGMADNSVLGPIQNKMQFNIVSSYVDDAIAKGGRVLTGGKAPGGKGYFYPVTLIADVDHGCLLVDEEQFGPALPIIRYSSVDDAIRKANSTSSGLGGSVWGSDIEAVKKVASQMECGTVWLNDHSTIRPHAPFGGVKQSGIGVSFGVEGLKEYTTIQSVIS